MYTPRILLIDNDEDWCKTLQESLDSLGYYIETQTEREEALDTLLSESFDFDIVVLNVRLTNNEDKITRKWTILLEQIKKKDAEVIVVTSENYPPHIDLGKLMRIAYKEFDVENFFVKESFNEEDYRKSILEAALKKQKVDPNRLPSHRPSPQPRILLRDVLAELFASAEDVNRILDDSDLDRTRIVLTSSAINTWHNILREAENQGSDAVNAIINIMQNELPDNLKLQEAINNYLLSQGIMHKGKFTGEDHQQSIPTSTERVMFLSKLPDDLRIKLIHILAQQSQWNSNQAQERIAMLLLVGLPHQFVHTLKLEGDPDSSAATIITELVQPGYMVEMVEFPDYTPLGLVVKHLYIHAIDIEGKELCARILLDYQLAKDEPFLHEVRTYLSQR